MHGLLHLSRTSREWLSVSGEEGSRGALTNDRGAAPSERQAREIVVAAGESGCSVTMEYAISSVRMRMRMSELFLLNVHCVTWNMCDFVSMQILTHTNIHKTYFTHTFALTLSFSPLTLSRTGKEPG